MLQDTPNSSSASNADHHHPSPPPSRLLSKHRPRRRSTAPRPPPPLPPPPPAPRGQPDLTLCHCCGVRFPPPHPGSRRHPLSLLASLWRVVLLCSECLSLVSSAAVCSYCLSLDDLPPEDSSAIACRRCGRCAHRSCILAEHRTALIQPVDVGDFLCVDCCPTVRSKNGGSGFGLNLEAYGENTVRKAVEVKSVSKRGKDLLTLPEVGGSGAEGRGSGDPALQDEELALKLHLAMNGSPRISRTGGYAEKGKGTKDAVCGRKGNRDQEICVTNMMAQLDDEAVPGRKKVLKRLRRIDPLITVVLALPCAKGKRAEESMKSKRKGPATKQLEDVVDRYKNKYSKRTSTKQRKVGNVASGTMRDADMDGDHGGNGVAPVR